MTCSPSTVGIDDDATADEVIADEEDIRLLEDTTVPEALLTEGNDDVTAIVPLPIIEPEAVTVRLETDNEETATPEAELTDPDPDADNDVPDATAAEDDHMTMPELFIQAPLPMPLLMTSTAAVAVCGAPRPSSLTSRGP